MTPAGQARLKAELDELWRVRRPEVVTALAAAAAEGDRSENAEYTFRKKQLGEIDRRVRYLGNRLQELRVVDALPTDPTAVHFGARVELEALDDGERAIYRIVGPDETDAARGWISIDSPVARALLKKRAGDVFGIDPSTGGREFQVLAVDYPGD